MESLSWIMNTSTRRRRKEIKMDVAEIRMLWSCGIPKLDNEHKYWRDNEREVVRCGGNKDVEMVMWSAKAG